MINLKEKKMKINITNLNIEIINLKIKIINLKIKIIRFENRNNFNIVRKFFRKYF